LLDDHARPNGHLPDDCVRGFFDIQLEPRYGPAAQNVVALSDDMRDSLIIKDCRLRTDHR
jgi:hypothetical protein